MFLRGGGGGEPASFSPYSRETQHPPCFLYKSNPPNVGLVGGPVSTPAVDIKVVLWRWMVTQAEPTGFESGSSDTKTEGAGVWAALGQTLLVTASPAPGLSGFPRVLGWFGVWSLSPQIGSQ